ncbi:hypothetical protein [Streptomyces chartreusis]|uniref:hypothetical protein n=1 Tax=Streptomyces chartreusis TaxID=1969 RepID=UPI0033B0B9E3
MDDVDAVTRAVLSASRLLVAVSARSLAEVEERGRLAQFRMLVGLAELLVTVRRRAEIAAIVQRLTPTQRLGLVEALAAFNEAGAEPLVPGPDVEPHSLGWGADVPVARDA